MSIYTALLFVKPSFHTNPNKLCFRYAYQFIYQPYSLPMRIKLLVMLKTKHFKLPSFQYLHFLMNSNK